MSKLACHLGDRCHLGSSAGLRSAEEEPPADIAADRQKDKISLVEGAVLNMKSKGSSRHILK